MKKPQQILEFIACTREFPGAYGQILQRLSGLEAAFDVSEVELGSIGKLLNLNSLTFHARNQDFGIGRSLAQLVEPSQEKPKLPLYRQVCRSGLVLCGEDLHREATKRLAADPIKLDQFRRLSSWHAVKAIDEVERMHGCPEIRRCPITEAKSWMTEDWRFGDNDSAEYPPCCQQGFIPPFGDLAPYEFEWNPVSSLTGLELRLRSRAFSTTPGALCFALNSLLFKRLYSSFEFEFPLMNVSAIESQFCDKTGMSFDSYIGRWIHEHDPGKLKLWKRNFASMAFGEGGIPFFSFLGGRLSVSNDRAVDLWRSYFQLLCSFLNQNLKTADFGYQAWETDETTPIFEMSDQFPEGFPPVKIPKMIFIVPVLSCCQKIDPSDHGRLGRQLETRISEIIHEIEVYGGESLYEIKRSYLGMVWKILRNQNICNEFLKKQGAKPHFWVHQLPAAEYPPQPGIF